MRSIKYLVIIVGVAGLMMLMAGASAAVTFTATGNPGDTLQGTVITAESTSASLEYTDINANPKPTVNPVGDIEVTVLPVYGFSMAALPDAVLGVGRTATNETYITSEGNNISDTYTLTFEADFTGDGVGTWTVNIMRSDDVLFTTLTAGATSYTTQAAIAEDSDFGFYHEVTAPTSEGAGGGQPGDQVVITTTATTDSTPVGQYTGANGLTYGGTSEVITVSTYSIEKPVMIVTRTSTVDAPIAGAYTGGIHDKVPGSVITFTITYSNEGNESASNVILIDKVPSGEGCDTNLAHFNQDAATTNVNITAAEGDGIGWTICYSTDPNPSTTYGDRGPNWTVVGTLSGGSEKFPGTGGLYENTSSEFSATYVKWEKTPVLTTELGDTLTWGVTIR